MSDSILITCKVSPFAAKLENYLLSFDEYKKVYRNGIFYFYLEDLNWDEEVHDECKDLAYFLSGSPDKLYAFIRTSKGSAKVQTNGAPHLFGLSLSVKED